MPKVAKFIVMEAASATPASWKWRGGPRGYRKIAVVETVDGVRPKMISERAKGVIRIVKIWDRLYEGKGKWSEYARAVQEAWALADQLNEKTAG